MVKVVVLIAALLVIQALYDFLLWFVVNREKKESAIAVYLRIFKIMLDYPLTIFVLLHFGLLKGCFISPLHILIVFYFVKWFHGCDTFYNIFSKLYGKKQDYWGDWRWWTPLGLLRCIFLGHCAVQGYSSIEYQFGAGVFGYYKLPLDLKKIPFSKGMVNVNEAYWMTIAAACLVVLYLSFILHLV